MTSRHLRRDDTVEVYHFSMQNMSCLEIGGCFAPRKQKSANIDGIEMMKSQNLLQS